MGVIQVHLNASQVHLDVIQEYFDVINGYCRLTGILDDFEGFDSLIQDKLHLQCVSPVGPMILSCLGSPDDSHHNNALRQNPIDTCHYVVWPCK